jgi:hypothetical protein
MDAEEKPAESDNMEERVVIHKLQSSELFFSFHTHKFKISLIYNFFSDSISKK